jgi:3-deoxy-manno-octulosonate cytidylyltransferase (CMP-KDO synthetase)
VARAQSGEALYFSRSAIPFVRDVPPDRWLDNHTFWGHIGVYGYQRQVLEAYPGLPISPLEQAESLEQLRFLDAGYRFQTVETTYRPVAVDVADDLERVRALIAG